METLKKHKLTILAYISLAVSILSVFTTVIGYTNSEGVHRIFTLVDFLLPNGNGFDSFVSCEYTGYVYMYVDISIIHIFVALGVVAIVCAVVGIYLISNQRENRISFVLTFIGLLGTVAPSVLILSCVILLKENYLGTITCGIYPIVSPIAMAICMYLAGKMHRVNIEYKKKLKAAEGLIFRGEDL